MKRLLRFYASTIGKKVVIAVTGLVLFGFIIGHMIGNLKAFGGFDSEGIAKLDHYAVYLREMGADMLGHMTFLWMVRGGLLLALILHVVTVIQLQALNRRARPVEYHRQRFSASTAAARTMFYGGLIILLFVILHILHFTTGDIHFQNFQHGHVYANIYQAFSIWWITLAYIAAMVALGSHLYHGVWSMFQTVGLDGPDSNEFWRMTAKASSLIIVLGFISVPLAILFGILPEPGTNFIASH